MQLQFNRRLRTSIIGQQYISSRKLRLVIKKILALLLVVVVEGLKKNCSLMWKGFLK
jgi:hypothetical protein